MAAWKQAEEKARLAENDLAAAWDALNAKKLREISPELLSRVATLRSVANEKLAATIQALKSTRS